MTLSYSRDSIKSFLKSPKVVVALIACVLFILFNRYLPSPQSEQQISYDSEVSTIIAQVRNPSFDQQKLAQTNISVESKGGEFKWTFKLPLSDLDQNEKVVRLMSLLSESKIFNKSVSSRADFQVRCTIAANEYVASFYKDDIVNNPPLGNFMKLAAVYSVR